MILLHWRPAKHTFNYVVKLGVWLWQLTLANGKKTQPKTEEIF